MCGLCGVYDLEGRPVPPEVIGRMNDALAHRGPDDSGEFFINTRTGDRTDSSGSQGRGDGYDLGLANRRLAILDLSPAGHQPMVMGDLVLVYNGEVYNYVELAEELRALGRTFRGSSDTEVILTAYDQWGLDCLEKFNGMFALALWDGRQKKLVLARDRFGIKPLYYHLVDGRLVFGSEIKALLRHPGVRVEPDRFALFNYLARNYRFVDGRPTSFFEKIRQVEPGSFVSADRSGLTERRWYALDPARPAPAMTEDEAVEQYRALLTDAVRIRLRSDVPVAFTLSGGMDSSAVTAISAQELGPGLPVFSACYDVEPFDEQKFIAPTVASAQAKWTKVFPGPADLIDTTRAMITAFDEPVCTVTFYAHWQVMAEVHGHGLKVILNGHGADELTAGYYDHFLHRLADLHLLGRRAEFEAERKKLIELHGDHRAGLLADYLGLVERRIPYMTDYLTAFAPYEECLDPEFLAAYAHPKPDSSPYPSRLSNRLFNELSHETVPAMLKAEDRVTMAFSIESRLPFLDYRLVEFCFALPNRFKIHEGLGKHVQRRALSNILPEAVTGRIDKVGFNAPSEIWFRGALKDQLREFFAGSKLFDRGIVQRPVFDRIVDQHQRGQANHYMFLWQCLNLELWFKEYFDRG
ncbi:MAG: asparagine synthase (glutamine-hydrolyzing) [Proteobacteria bacterium]|nr:asparagine synthase (glutamine-hydrolyzing) [Pseudomonadota bacterium]MBU1741906.1 asparagine synthase (glutamine-hydrolyzing) [Pseudomonadota bacterium]